MQRYIQGYSAKAATGWHLLASPVNNMTILGSDFVPGTVSPNLDDLFAWDEEGYKWLNYKVGANNITNFVNGQGYLASYETTGTKNFTGTFNNSNIVFNNLSQTTSKGNGWHLLGNPFQSALRWTNTDWARSNFGAGAKIMNSGGSYTDIVFGIKDTIPANQGFFVQATNATNSITIPASQRVHSSKAFSKSEITNFLTLRAGDGTSYVETWIQIMDDATSAFDQQYDVNFLGGMYEAPYLYSKISETERLSTNRIAPVEEETIVQLAFKSFVDKQFTITATNAESFGSEMDVILEDSQTDIQVNLKEISEYTFTAAAGQLTERFKVHLLKSTGVHENGQTSALLIYANANQIYFNVSKPARALISVFNITGQQVYSTSLQLNGLKQITLNLPTGWYVVRAICNDGIKSQKIFIR